MTLFALAFLAGVLTIASPRILPVLPFVFARSDRRFIDSCLPMLIGMAAAIMDRTFSIEFLDPGARAYSFTFG